MTLAGSTSTDKSLKDFDELMSTPIDFSGYILNGLKIKNLTQNPVRTSILDTQRAPLLPFKYFINNDLKYLQGGVSTMTYTTSTTKIKAAQYDLPGIEDMVPNIWSPVKVAYDKYALWGISHWREQRKSFYAYARGRKSRDVYSTKCIMAVTHVKVMGKHGYGYLEEIVVRRADNVLYRFKEGDFPRLRINDIEDMLLLVVQNRLINLSGDDVADFVIALRMFTRSLVIQKRVEDLQLGVESYQKQINVTKPDTTRPDLRKRHPYTPYKDPQGFIYVDDFKRNRLMRSDELYKFSDGTLTRLLSSLEDITKNIDIEYLPKRRWGTLEKKRAHFMIKDINKLLKERRMMRSLDAVRIGIQSHDPARTEGSTQGYPLVSVEVHRFNTSAGNPVMEFFFKLNLHVTGICKDGDGDTLQLPFEFTISGRSTALMVEHQMAVAAHKTNNSTIKSILLAKKLTRSNFTNWYRNLRIVLMYEKKLKFLEQPIGPAPDPETADPNIIDKYYESINLEQEVACLMLSRRWSVSKLLSLEDEELLGIPKKAETPTVLAIWEGKIQKDKKKPRGAKGKGKGKTKLAYAPKTKIPPSPKRDNPTKDSVCHHYHKVGYWRRNYPSYHADLKKRKNASIASTSSIFTIKLYAFPNKTWVYNTGCGTHICNTSQGLRGSRKLKYGALSLYVGNGMPAAVEVIGSFDLVLPTIKRAKHALDSSYLWHCHLGHINKKRIDKLQCDGILQPTHDESLEKCKSCISGKMTCKPFLHQVERAKDPLGLIHTDVCGPFRIVSREGASYSITFTDDFSRYGYPKETMGYYFYYPLENKNFVARNAEFFENNLMVQEASGSHGLLKASGSDVGLELIQEDDTQPSINTSEIHDEVMPTEAPFGGDLNEPPNYKAALYDLESDKWLEAMNTEMQSMKDNQVWILVDLPPNGQTVGSKWLFKKKTDIDGNVYTFKARLVAKGYTQTYGVDYEENFSPVADIRAIRILLAIAAFYDYEIWQMDVKPVFLNVYLSEDVYMVQPKGFVDPKHPNKVCKLQRSIYGLKQASRSWNKRFDVEIKKIGFTQNPDEPCVYLKASGSNVAFLVLYVDDILLMGNNVTMLQEVKSWLLSKILKKFRMENSKKGYTLMVEKPDYRKSQCAQTPNEIQWTAVKTILKYLRNTKDMVLVYGEKPKTELKVSCYADVSFQTDKDDTKSQTGYVLVLNGGAMDWKSAKQSTTAMSSTEAEYIAAAEASMEAVWMRKFID
ncbi:retrotransposon protein, putative, ty1-copia subclass [Tanacetum coccineum]